MSWLVAHIDDEHERPDQAAIARALARPSLPEADHVAIACAPHAVLGHARRATSKRELKSPQPFCDEARGLCVVADIRLDEREELCRQLDLDRDASDVEILAEGYRRFGTGIVAKLVGAFALVLWDARSRTLLAARDPMGERPLYYRAHGGRLWLASSVEQLLFVASGLPPIDDETVFGFLGGEYARTEATFFRDIHRLPPGHFLVARLGCEPTTHRYWHAPDRFLAFADENEVHEGFRELLEKAVRARLDSEGPVLIQLSGGLDSSSIACLADAAHRQSPESLPPMRLVSGLYPGLDCDESRFIREVVEKVALPWEGFDATDFDFVDLEKPYLDGPGGRSSQAGNARDLEMARQHGARVLLSGFGGDDVGSESGIFRDLAALGRYRTLVEQTLLVPEFHWGSRLRMLREGVKGLIPMAFGDWYQRQRLRRNGGAPSWLGPRLRELWPGPRPIEASKRRWLSHNQAWLFRAFTHPNRIHCVDIEQRQAEEAGVVVRYPFLDVRLADFVLAIPPELRIPNGSYRVIQRKAMAGVLPQAIAARHVATTFEAAFLLRAKKGLPRFRPFFEEGEWLSEPYADREVLRRAARTLGGAAGPEGYALYRALENVALLEAWLRAVRAEARQAWSAQRQAVSSPPRRKP